MSKNIQRLYISILLVSSSITANSQDSLHFQGLDGRMHTQWKQKWTGMRIGLGGQRNFCSELGVSTIHSTHHDSLKKIAAIFCNYSSIEWTKPDVFAAKIGLETWGKGLGTILAMGIEASYQTDFHKNDFVLQPRIGTGFIVFSLFLGYNISFNHRPFDNISQFQCLIVFNMFSGVMKKI